MNNAKIKFTNTLTREKEEFEPINPGRVLMYNCGPTVYNFAHIGNLRSYVFADTIKRVLEFNNYKVKQVINITDVGHLTGDNLGDADTGEDKIEEGAKRENKTVKETVEHFQDAFFEDIKDLNMKTEDTKFPKATEYIEEQIDLIKKLEEKGYTYQTSDGIYFDTSKFENYGKLGNIDIKGLEEGARIEPNKEKRNFTDFSLWKFSKEGENRTQEWESPWGVGYPGWHLECSAMAMGVLGEEIDIHTGGIDHVPVHHNNEIAQSESITGKQFSRFWLHHGHLNIDSKKVSKSLGNMLLLRDLVEKNISPISYRYFILGAHYSTPINFTWDAVNSAQTALFKIYRLYGIEMEEIEIGTMPQKYMEKLLEFSNDDLDTPKVIALMWDMIKDENLSFAEKKAGFIEFDKVLGLDISNAREILNTYSQEGEKISVEEAPKHIKEMVKEREKAREEKDWGKADELRDKIQKEGYGVEDSDWGPVLRRI